MYLKICKNYNVESKQSSEDHKKWSPESDLSVDLKEQKADEQSKGIVRIYIGLCILLCAICLFLVVIIVFLVMRPAPPACLQKVINEQEYKNPEVCNLQTCSAKFPQFQALLSGCQRCPDGWLPFEGSCFYLSKRKSSWEGSRRICQADGGDLAVITSQNVQNLLSDGSNLSYWIGLKLIENKWTWVNNNPVGESYWSGDAEHGSCGILNRGGPSDKNWTTGLCHAYTYFICQKQQ